MGMQFTCNRSVLAEVASLVGQAVASKSTKKVFECVRLVAGAGYVELSGTDLEVAMRSRVDAEVQTEGQAVVPASLFSGVLREIGDDTISVAVDRQKLVIDKQFGDIDSDIDSRFKDIDSRFVARAVVVDARARAFFGDDVEPADARTEIVAEAKGGWRNNAETFGILVALVGAFVGYRKHQSGGGK